MKLCEALIQIGNHEGRIQKFARRINWRPRERIGYGFNENDLLQKPILLKDDEKMNTKPYFPSQDDLTANDWEVSI